MNDIARDIFKLYVGSSGQYAPKRAAGILNARESNSESSASPSFSLSQNYPNPFGIATSNLYTTIEYTIPDDGRVSLTVFDQLGRKVKTLDNEYKRVGAHSVVFYANQLPAGVYHYVLRFSGNVQIRTMILVK